MKWLYNRYAWKLHCFISRVPLFFGLIVKLRNQCNCIIEKFVSDGSDLNFNGELLLIKHIGKFSNSWVDIGAHAGDWSEEFIKNCRNSNLRGYIIEPIPSFKSILLRRFNNKYVKLIINPISDTEKEVEFLIEGQSSRIHPDTSNTEYIKLKTKTLDSIFDQETFDIIKIDCEGHDMKILAGSTNLLRDKRVKFIQFEYNHYWLEQGSSLYQAITLLNGFGYNIYRIYNNGIKEFKYDELGDYFRYSNYLAVLNSSSSEIEPILIK
jgi:FkbM family methyltransferase